MAKNGAQYKSYRFAVAYKGKASYTEDGQWQTLNDVAVWRLEIDAEYAESINLGFKNVFLPPQTKLFIYNEDKSEVVVFTEADNNQDQQIWSTGL